MIKKVELLCPVGNKKMAYLAIHNGADAIYLAGKQYGARKFAENFTNQELTEIIKYAHLYNVKVFITVNTMIYENELDEALKYIEFLYKNNVDALIMQDLGLISLTRKYYPNLEIHASTQCHNHNKSGLQLWKDLGLKRVVLDRELSKEEIKDLNKIDIEKEIFIYGALCICYSGCCLFSSLNGGRSGNRGECVGCCRLPYKVLPSKKEIYPLSTKELNTLNQLNELIDLGVSSFKIEGRMKSPSYVGYVTKCTRKIIDSYYNNKPISLSKEEEINLKKLYNRGFTKGHILNDNNIINNNTPNHQGIEIGKVLETKNNKIKIKITNDYLHQEDGIRFKTSNKGMIINKLYNEKYLLVNKLNKNEIGYLDKKVIPKKDDIILKTTDYELTKEIENYTPKRIPITIKVIAKINSPLIIEITDNENTISKQSIIVEKSEKQEVTKQDIEKQLSKLGNTPYTLNKLIIEKDNNIYIRLSTLNELRRTLTEELTNIRMNKKNYQSTILKKEILPDLDIIPTNRLLIHVSVKNEKQLLTCIKYNIKSIYVTNKELYKKYKNKYNLYYRIPRVNIEEPPYKDENLLVSDLGSTYLYTKNNKVITDYYLNVSNHATINKLLSMNTERVTISLELDKEKIKDIMKKTKEKDKIELLIYGKPELMIIKSSIEEGLLEDKTHHQYKITKENNLTHLYHHETINNIDNIKLYQNLGISNYRIEFIDEKEFEIEELLKKIL